MEKNLEGGRGPEREHKRKAEYLREMKQNYLMFEAEERQEQGYEARMLIGNSIEGLLKFRIKKMDNRCKFCYEITSKQPLSRLLETISLGENQIRKLLLGIIQILSSLEDYLLAEEQILLEPDYVYIDPEIYQPFLCLIPGKKGNFPEEFSKFLQFLLEKVDHQDKEAVVLIYGMYRESLKENYGLDNLLKWLVKENYPIMDSLKKGETYETITSEKIESWEIDERENAQEEELKPSQPEQAADSSEANMWYPYFLPAAILFILAVGVRFFSGRQSLKRYGTPMAMIGVVLLIAGGAFWVYRFVARQKKQGSPFLLYSRNSHDQSSHNQQVFPPSYQNVKESLKTSVEPGQWQMIFEEPEETESEEISELPKTEPEEMHTVLLWNQEEEDIRSLVSIDGKDSILLPYFPFIIGKQEGLCDHVISKNTVSRLHIRIDEADEGYLITDLNSTNGTYVNSRCLDANETVLIHPGDEVGIADLKFRLK